MQAVHSSVSAQPNGPKLFFEQPDAGQVRVQLFGIMLGNQILRNRAAAQKGGAKTKRKAPDGMEGQPPRQKSDSIMNKAKEDTLLRFALWPEWLNKNGKSSIREIVDFAMQTSPKMESFMIEAYNHLLETDDHLCMMAAIFFYIYWWCDFDHQTESLLSRKPSPPDSFLSTTLVLDEETVRNMCSACYAFERGQRKMTSFPSFVHTFVTMHFKRVIC